MRSAVPAFAAFVAFGTLAMVTAAATVASAAPLDASKVVTAQACRECHVSAYEVWDDTKHATGFKTLHRQQNATEIAERMGFRLIKRDSLCLECHYTPILSDGELRADSGVSCESCHGAGRDYLNIHNDYGGKGIDHAGESPEHRRARIAASVAAGMRRPSTDLYGLASSCYGCHSVPNEALINVGRHSLGSADFELASFTEDKIRHNFLESMIHSDGTANATRPIEFRRRLLVLGKILAVEYSLRGLAAATEDGVFLKAGQKRLRRATTDLRRVAQATGAEEAISMVAAVRGVEARLGRQAQLLAAADRIGELGRGFLEHHDGTRLAAIDPLLEGKDLPVLDDPEDEDEDGESGAVAVAALGTEAGQRQPQAGSPNTGSARAASSAASKASSQTTASTAVPAVGDKRSHIRPTSSHKTLEVTACQKCHGDQNAWWFKDRHYASIEPFLDRGAKQTKIARLYGISPSRMAIGSTLCMDCHGTVATEDASSEAVDGVSCQSCHGPAADFLDIHQAKEGEVLSPQRPGYLKALQVGMNDMRNLDTAVRICATCHYVTDPRLISSGHTSGLDFDIAGAMAKTRHWRADVPPAAQLTKIWTAVLAERGAVPQVPLARLAESPPAGDSQDGTPTGRAQRVATTPTAARSNAIPGDRPDRVAFEPRPADSRGLPESRTSDRPLPVLPAIADDTPIEDVLLLLQRRLQELYEALGGPVRAGEGGGGG